MEVNFGIISFKPSELSNWVRGVFRRLKSEENPFNTIPEPTVSKMLTNAVVYLLNDRLNGGIGKGGWGVSDQTYMRHLYGNEAAAQGPPDSVMTTAVVVLGLQAYCALLGRSNTERTKKSAEGLQNEILSGLRGYVKPRWDRRTGYGGTLARGREADPKMTLSYRHTAWFLRLWLSVPGYLKNGLTTAQCLLDRFEDVDWEEEKVATAVAAHSALNLALSTEPVCRALDANRATYLVNCLQDVIVAKYRKDVRGWTSGISRVGGRQPYTLFVLSEMAHAYDKGPSALTEMMSEALEDTISGRWQAGDSPGVPRVPGGPPSISMSCLAISALARKHEMTRQENDFFGGVVDFLSEALAGDQRNMTHTYSWALSYFVKDICESLLR